MRFQQIKLSLGYIGMELLEQKFDIDFDELLEEHPTPIVEYLCENDDYEGLITIKYIHHLDEADADKDPLICIYMDGKYLYDLDHYTQDDGFNNLEYIKELHENYLERLATEKYDFEKLIKIKYQKHYAREILQKKININNCIDSILMFL